MRHTINLLGILLVLTAARSSSASSCTYGPRGSLTSTCTITLPKYFRLTNYRFDHLDETVRCVNCVLNVIEHNTFDITGNQIKILDLNNSQIQTLQYKAFIGLIFLEKLILTNNKISVVEAGAFTGVNKIRELNMENNTLTVLKTDGTKELTNLKVFNLKNNKIKNIENGSFSGLQALEELNLSNNQLENVVGVFEGLTNLQSLNLENNKITDIRFNETDKQFYSLVSLLSLNLARNNLQSIPDSTFLALNYLEILDLSYNPITTLDSDTFRGLYSLQKLYLNNAQITTIEKGYFRELRSLTKINLSYNNITTILTGVYSGIPELRELNLSHNSIDTYKRTGIYPLHRLHTLDLSYNKLTDLDYKDFDKHLPSLSFLKLDNNPWACNLGKDMDEYFKEDGLHYDVGDKFEDPNLKCPSSKKNVEEGTVVSYLGAQSRVMQKSDNHEIVLYIFICVTMSLMAYLFYLQYKIQKDIKEISGNL